MSGSPSTVSFMRRIRKRFAHWIGEEGKLDVHASMFELLFPGEPYTAEKAGALAERLRREAERLERLCTSGNAGAGRVQAAAGSGPSTGTGGKKKRSGELDFSKYQKRNVALDIAYRGFDYQGFARSEDADKTIEAELFEAMRRTKLIPEGVGWRELGYSRGGRTDKGVSASGQVVALQLRSKALVGADPVDEKDEYDYCRMINSVMSENVRVVGWKTIHPEFSARFSAKSRAYKYFFVRRRGEIDVDGMREAAGYLVGDHDYRNFCKADIPTVTNFVRRIASATVEQRADAGAEGYEVYELNIVGTAFLWHQIRCIAAVLVMVGEGLETPGVVRELLDVEKMPCKPQYKMADPEPLLLYECSYDELDGQWTRPLHVIRGFDREIDEEVRKLLTKAQVLLRTRDRVLGTGGATGGERVEDVEMAGEDTGNVSKREPRYIPIVERKREPSIEERLARHGLSIVSRPPRER